MIAIVSVFATSSKVWWDKSRKPHQDERLTEGRKGERLRARKVGRMGKLLMMIRRLLGVRSDRTALPIENGAGGVTV